MLLIFWEKAWRAHSQGGWLRLKKGSSQHTFTSPLALSRTGLLLHTYFPSMLAFDYRLGWLEHAAWHVLPHTKQIQVALGWTSAGCKLSQRKAPATMHLPHDLETVFISRQGMSLSNNVCAV